ncbi:hypothetical protein CVU37_08300 [candidate division BRC1 bacterium HGW-BRC1-1]|jgi:8-oxo-dGTP pyrophosphatase MutT (NUDIX family)|nr:MAG: hypothetical protein CVU37_08300 [candidate division BRC1 bacterium HGW-BRC1-1]
MDHPAHSCTHNSPKGGLLVKNKRYKVQVQIHFVEPDTERIVFLVLRRPEKRGGIWQSITGNVDEGEDAVICAAREVWEETGIGRIDACRPVYEYEFENEGTLFHETVFVARVHTPEVKLSPEHVEFRWLTYEEARSIIHYEGIQIGLDYAWKKLQDNQ